MLTLQAGDASLVLAPEIGGAIGGWTIGGRPMLRAPSADAIRRGDVHGMACFPLVPFSNRIAWGRFHWAGRDHVLDRNLGDHPHAIHGVGWQAAWRVAAVSSDAATLALAHHAIGEQARHWPFAFEAEQRFALAADNLRVTLSITNRHAGPAPAGLGLHPYFPRSPDATLRFAAKQVWLNGEDMLPARRIDVPSAWDHTHGLPIGGAALDNCFAGWDGTAGISWSSGVALSVTASGLFRHLIVFTPPGQEYFCVEPVSHMTDAINRMDSAGDHGLRVLGPGETLQGEVTFRLAAA